MTPATKIMVGALATALLAAVLHWPMGFGARCAAVASAVAAFAQQNRLPTDGPQRSSPSDVSQNVANCQAGIDAALVNGKIEFLAGGSDLIQTSMPVVIAVANAIKTCSDSKIEIAGHTVRVGDDALNMQISSNRAKTVMAALVAEGVAPGNLVAEGYGETRPIEPDAREDNPADDRVAFKVMSIMPVAAQ